MMRPIDHDSGFRAYVEGLVDAMLRIDQSNRYLLLYRTKKWFGRFASFPQAREVLVDRPQNTLLWDQVAMPYWAWRERADVIFNPKFSVPLLSPCPPTMGLQEPAPWVEPEHYERLDVLYERIMLPLYCRRAAHIFPMAHWILEENRKHLGLPFPRTTVTWPAPQEHLRPVTDRAALDEFRARYHLPEQFIVAVTRVDHPGLAGSTSFYPGKNPHTTLRAFLEIRDRIPHGLVIAGRRVRDYLLYMGFTDADFERVRFVDFIPFDELPKLYSLADLGVFPAFYEGFGFSLLGAMACGCPVIASKTGACPEVVAGGAPLVDPRDPHDVARVMLEVLGDPALRQRIRARGLARAAELSWEETARLTLKGLAMAAGRRGEPSTPKQVPRAARELAEHR
ncbi:MAG TPA: glycosyltransferase family 1 protein [Gemmatimonadales bacterium]|nr:glycosyltransferase family 1 protein [Gemmatimonadales bacterium]